MKTLFPTLLLVLFVLPAYGWHTNTHYQMTKDATVLMPPDLKKILTSNTKFVEAGIKDPDVLLRDWQNHYFIPSEPPQGGGLDRVEKIIKIVQTKLQAGNQMDAGKQLCYLAHYIGDLWNPEGLIKNSDTTANSDFVNNENLVVVFEGYSEPIENYHDYFIGRTRWRWNLENSPEASRILYNEAVNDIAKVWLSLWQQSGHPVEKLAIQMMEHKKGALNVNFARLLFEEWDTWDSAKTEERWEDRSVAHYKEMDRLRSNVVPTSGEDLARSEVRNQQQWMNRMSPTAPFQMLETSLKTIGEKAFLVARFRNKLPEEIPSVAFMYPGLKGPAALITKIQPGEVIKVEATLPANAQREKIQMVYASTDTQ